MSVGVLVVQVQAVSPTDKHGQTQQAIEQDEFNHLLQSPFSRFRVFASQPLAGTDPLGLVSLAYWRMPTANSWDVSPGNVSSISQ